MITTNISRDPSAALEYYQQSLSQDDFKYYQSDGIKTFYQGKLAKRLGLQSKEVTAKTFSSLLNGIDPITGKRLRLREIEQARVGYDFTTNCPKSVSIVYAITKDEAILDALQHANSQMMSAIESYAQFQANTETNRVYKYSKELIYSSYLHHTTRPNESSMLGKKMLIPDCHLHIHNYIHAFTYNAEKHRYQALELGDGVYRRLPRFEKTFHSILAYQLQKAGYQIERNQHGFFELAGVSRSVVDRFSNRTKAIEQFARAKNITDPKIKGQLGAKLRHSKSETSLTDAKLHTHWMDRLSARELELIKTLKDRKFENEPRLSVKEGVTRAISHHLEREAAAPIDKVIATSLSYGYGAYLPSDVERELHSRNNVLTHEIDGLVYMTTDEVRQAEEKLIRLATNGKGKYPSLNSHYIPKPDFLNTQQVNAIKTILSSTDRTMILRGSAGVGKSLLLNSVAEGVSQAGKSVFATAPSTQATKVLSNQGFEACTVAALLHNPKQQQKLRNQVLFLDEAGLCGLQNTTDILSICEKHSTRLIMSGDSRQHSAPAQLEALSILEKQAQVQTVTVNKIMRQKPHAYKAAIQKLATGRTLEGYLDLDKKLGAVQEIPDHEKRLNQIADDYINSVSKGRSALIVSPTHYEGDIINNIVRDKLRSRGQIKGKEHHIDRLINLSLTESQKQDLVNYSEGLVIRFAKNQKGGFKAGSHYEVLPKKTSQSVSIKDLKSGQILKLPANNTTHFDVFKKNKETLAQGDLIRLTQNIKSEGKKLNNGNTYKIERFVKNGIKLSNGKTISSDSYHWKHGYSETSHSSQGKTKDDVFISMSDMSFAAVNEQTLYVAASRGKYSASIYTSSKEDLKKAVTRSGTRITAREVAEGHELRLLKQKQQAHHQALNEKIKSHGRVRTQKRQAPKGFSKAPK